VFPYSVFFTVGLCNYGPQESKVDSFQGCFKLKSERALLRAFLCSYVAVSRVKALNGVLLERPFDFAHFRRTNSTVSQEWEIDFVGAYGRCMVIADRRKNFYGSCELLRIPTDPMNSYGGP
jgi:hypothetical protein